MPDMPDTLETDRYLQAQRDRQAAIEWARALLDGPLNAVILDLETTGRDKATAEIVQIGILSLEGETLLDSLVKPPRPIPPAATAIHHITDEMVAQAPTLAELYDQIHAALSERGVIVYNAGYDAHVLNNCRRRAGLPKFGVLRYECAMLQYADFVGEWDSIHGNNRWQKLPDAEHGAIGDCRQTLELIRKMAEVGDIEDHENYDEDEER